MTIDEACIFYKFFGTNVPSRKHKNEYAIGFHEMNIILFVPIMLQMNYGSNLMITGHL